MIDSSQKSNVTQEKAEKDIAEGLKSFIKTGKMTALEVHPYQGDSGQQRVIMIATLRE